MAGIKAPIRDMLAKLATLNVVNNDNKSVPLYARVWNNQLKYADDGHTYTFPLPAAFVELVNPAKYVRIGNGMDEGNLMWRIHLIHEFLDAGDETTQEQDLTIFDLRDKIVTLFSDFKPTACSNLLRIGEEQEYDHSNVYHYVIEFTCSFIDSLGSPFDPASSVYIQTTTPTALETDITTGTGTDKTTRPEYNIKAVTNK